MTEISPAGDLLDAVDEADALERLHELGCTDGLPVVVPTRERVDRMVLATGLDGDLSLGVLGPGMGVATVDLVATAAVMAGCLPDHMALVVAAVQAIADPRFDLAEMQATTHCTAPMMIVNGPARHDCGIASGFGALGPGHRGNAAVGRALRLIMINIGGGQPGVSDMALLGHPGKFSYCLAEAEEESPWEPWHVSEGFEADQSVVTVIGAEAPSSAIAVLDGDDPQSCERIIRSVASVFSAVASNTSLSNGGAAVVILNPQHARGLADAGYSRRDVQEAITARSGNERDALTTLQPSRFTTGDWPSWIPCFDRPDDVVVIVAGGGGIYSMAAPTWSAGPHHNRFVSVAAELGQACAIPSVSQA
jgi:hypothetical protein